jgi:hypothetical protein
MVHVDPLGWLSTPELTATLQLRISASCAKTHRVEPFCRAALAVVYIWLDIKTISIRTSNLLP